MTEQRPPRIRTDTSCAFAHHTMQVRVPAIVDEVLSNNPDYPDTVRERLHRLADALRRLIAAGVPLEGASDHGVSEALYLRDPDGNGVELYWDRAQDQWPRTADGGINMFTRALDVRALLDEAPAV